MHHSDAEAGEPPFRKKLENPFDRVIVTIVEHTCARTWMGTIQAQEKDPPVGGCGV